MSVQLMHSMSLVPTTCNHLQALWEPKKTLRDWGKTEYKIVRNWTPREASAPQTHPPSDRDEIDDESPLGLKRFHGITSQRNILEKSHSVHTTRVPSENESSSNDSKDLEGDSVIDDLTVSSGVEDESIPQAGHIEMSIPTKAQHSSLTKNQSTRQNSSTVLSVTKRQTRLTKNRSTRQNSFSETTRRVSIEDDNNTVPESVSSESADSSQSVSADSAQSVSARMILKTRQSVAARSTLRNPSPANSMTVSASSVSIASGTGSDELQREGNEDVRLPMLSEEEKSQTSSQNEAIHDKENSVDEDMEESEGDVHAFSAPDIPKQKRSHKGRTKSKVLPKHSGNSLKMKLWHPKGIRRSKRDVNALDVCLTAYERVMRNTLDECGSEDLQTAIMVHWKQTQKHCLSMVRNVHNASMLEKLERKEKLKQNQLQREMSSTLTSLRKAHGRYQKALSKAKQAKKNEEEYAVNEEIAIVDDGLRSILSSYQQ